MILNRELYEQLTTAHRHDLLEAAERSRLAAGACERRGTLAEGEPGRSVRWPAGRHRRATLRPCGRPASPPTVTR